MKVTLLGATGTIGAATARALRSRGWALTTPARTDWPQLGEMMRGSDAVISCMASRTGAPWDAWHVDYGLNAAALKAALAVRVPQFVLLSAICVQKPRLAFQRAKLAFETELQAAEITHSIVRPTAFFKSLSGQLERMRAGKPYLMFGDGTLTACKPISDNDLARFLADCLEDGNKQNIILPIGGPGPAITPRAQGALLADSLGIALRTRSVPPGVLRAVARGLSLPTKIPGTRFTGLMAKAELARIGHYYATESMLVWDGQRYSEDATPSFGSETLASHYHALAQCLISDDRGAHAVF